jgi:uncharacterized Zn-binding protein involved in type VI secretion
MLGVVRKGDMSTGDPCKAPPRKAAGGSPNVFANGLPIMRVGDKYEDHSCPGSPPHSATASSGSSKVFINGRPAHRHGDKISCGSKADKCSPNVLIG